jgi:uncharacterized membrane protein YccC
VAIPLLVVLVPDRDQALFKAAQRGIGAILGVATTLALLTLVGTEPVIILLTLVATFGTVAFYQANYAIYAFFLTNTVLLYYWLATGHDLDGPGQRLIATILGLGLAPHRGGRDGGPSTTKAAADSRAVTALSTWRSLRIVPLRGTS